MPADPEKFEVSTSKEVFAATAGVASGLIVSFTVVRSPLEVAGDIGAASDYLLKYGVPFVAPPREYVAQVEQNEHSYPTPHEVEGFLVFPVIGVALFTAITHAVRRRNFKKNQVLKKAMDMEQQINEFSRELDAWGVDTRKH